MKLGRDLPYLLETDTTSRPMLAPCLMLLCEALTKRMEEKLLDGAADKARFEIHNGEVCLVVPLPVFDQTARGIVEAVPLVTDDPAEASEILETYGVVPAGWSSDPLRLWPAWNSTNEGRFDGGAQGGECFGAEATPARLLPAAPSVARLVAVASLGWARAEALGLACARMLGSSAKKIAWDVCTEGEATSSMRGNLFDACRDESRKRGMSQAPCDAISDLGALLLRVDREVVTLAAPHLGHTLPRVANLVSTEQGSVTVFARTT